MALRPCLFALAAVLSLFCPRGIAAIPDFGDAFQPTFTFTETYIKNVGFDSEFQEFVERTQARLVGTFRASTNGVNTTTFQEDPEAVLDDAVLVVEANNLVLDLPLIDGEKSVDSSGRNVVKWILSGTNPDTFEPIDEAGEVTLRYNGNDLTVTITANNVPDDYNIFAPDLAGSDETLEDAPIFFTLTLGDYEYRDATVFVDGVAKLYERTVGSGDNEQTFSDLPDVRIGGEVDVTKPVVKITVPAGNLTVSAPSVNLSGTASDEHGIFQVLVRVGDGEPVEADYEASGSWSLANIPLQPGKNTITVQSIDLSNNTSAPAIRTVTYSVSSELTVNAAGTGSGSVSGFLSTFKYSAGTTSPVRQGPLEAGETVTLTAKPAPGSAFDGWTSNVPLTPEQATAQRLVFDMVPAATLTANFVQTPFPPLAGKYTGLVLSEDAGGRGILTGKLTSGGNFTLVAKIGKLKIPLKGIFTASGEFAGRKKVGGVEYIFELELDVAPDGSRTITGTIVGGGVEVAVSLDPTPYKGGLPAPAELVGAYTFLIPPSGSAPALYPAGIGYGRAKVAASGKVKIAGVLGDGTVFSAATSLTRQDTFPFFASLYGKAGSISGMALLDPENPANDLAGTLAWYKPAGAKPPAVHPAGFDGESVLEGVRFTKPTAGQRLFLADSAGQGVLRIAAPQSAELPELNETFDVTLDTANKLTIAPNAGASIQSLKFKIVPNTGLFSGSFVDSGVVRKFGGVIAGSKLDRAGGTVSRSPLPGSISIEAAPAPE